MAKILNKLAPFLQMKINLINWLLDSCPESTKKLILGRVIAKQLPKNHLHGKPIKKNISASVKLEASPDQVNAVTPRSAE